MLLDIIKILVLAVITFAAITIIVRFIKALYRKFSRVKTARAKLINEFVITAPHRTLYEGLPDTIYYLIFETEQGVHKKLTAEMKQYRRYILNEWGDLTYKGPRLLTFKGEETEDSHKV